VASLVFR